MLISNCGFPERHHFDALLEQFRLMSGDAGPLIGAVLCPAGEVLKHLDANWYFDALRAAGKEIVTDGFIRPETAEVLQKNIHSA